MTTELVGVLGRRYHDMPCTSVPGRAGFPPVVSGAIRRWPARHGRPRHWSFGKSRASSIPEELQLQHNREIGISGDSGASLKQCTGRRHSCK